MSEMNDTSALENLKYAHAIDVSLDLSSQEVHELWADIEARDKRIAELKESDKHWAGNVKVCMQLIERYESAIAELEEQVWNLNLENERLEEAYWIDETISPDGTLKPSVRKLLERLEKAETDLRLSDDLVKALDNRIAKLEAALKEATETIGIDQFITHYNDAISAGKVSVDVKTSTDNNKGE